MSKRESAVAALEAARRFKLAELLPWLATAAVFVFLPDYLPLGAQVGIMILFALSLDLLVGYAGIVTLGHAAFFGVGAYAAGILSVSGWTEPISGLLVGSAAAGCVGLVTGAVILRTAGLTLLMLGMAATLILHEAANHLGWLTGGADGLQGITMRPLFGIFEFDLYGQVAYVYTFLVLFLALVVVRTMVNAPFGRALVGIRENATRMTAIGAPVRRRKLVLFTIAATLAGLAGALSSQVNQFVGLNVLSFELSGTVLVILVLGGAGRLYGAFIGAPLYFIAQDWLSKGDPVFWLFWLGLVLVAVVMFARGGVLGVLDLLRAKMVRRRSRATSRLEEAR